MMVIIFGFKSPTDDLSTGASETGTMRYPASQTAEKHERILREAARLFRERGFDGAGVADIMKAAGLTHGAFYAHFPSKDALQAEAVERAFAQSDNRIYALTANAGDPKRAFLDGYLSAAHRDHPGSGCVMAALGPEIARDSAARRPFTQRVKHMIDRMAARFRWKRKGAARRNAIHLLSAAVGALTLARAVDDPRLSDEILESVRDSLTSL
jgi:TetR/AcrR family transcriptional regulator, transcriptional repressor for nem operon